MMTRKNAIRLAVAAIGVLALGMGVLQGGFRDTLQKAIYICLECVGIG